ncbi:MAG: VOC family protein [Sphingomicrobium sp.]|nr:VOC family protein [Sphingomonadales bacterium]
MTNPHGSFIWYELMSPDPEGSKAFYDAVVGWDIEPTSAGDLDYRMIRRQDGGNAGGVIRLTDEMRSHGARPLWLGYVGVDDVDATVEAVKARGGSVLMPPWTIEGVGRIAMVTDPSYNPFYVMRGAAEGASSDVFSTDRPQHVSWNELGTADPEGARRFYRELFGWSSDEFMPMGEQGEYRFLFHHGVRIGAMCGVMPGGTGGWRYYIRVPSIAAAIEAINARGGKVSIGPHEVPGGDHIVIGVDPQGAEFALVGKQ